jgi:hypothetical protein
MSRTVSTQAILTKISDPIKCCRCEAIAVWRYDPDDRTETHFCDEHIERGCSCTEEPINRYAPPGHPDKDIMVFEVDELGRKAPCVEYKYDPDGFDF